MNIILASKSPRRQKILNRLQISFDVMIPDVDESMIISNENPEKYCKDLAKLKANEISHHFPENLVIGADTIVVISEEIFGKPINKTAAKNMLEALSGKTHNVYTGVSLNHIEKNIDHQFAEITSVTFRELDKKEIAYYIETQSPYDKAGGYGIQEWSAIFVKEIRGCYDNVVGFPLSRFYQELKKLNINVLDTAS